MRKTFKFENFEPDSNLTGLARQVLKDFNRKAPSQSSIELIVKKVKDGFDGTLTVRSFHGRFSDRGLSLDASALLNELSSKVGKQIHLWKQSRFPVRKALKTAETAGA